MFYQEKSGNPGVETFRVHRKSKVATFQQNPFFSRKSFFGRRPKR
jgi:hypothetical protein